MQVGTQRVYTKIDKALVNDVWMERFLKAYSNFLPEGMFDHCPCLVKVNGDTIGGHKPFKYFNMWSKHENFIGSMKEVWKESIAGVPMYRVTQKLKKLKHILKQLNKSSFSEISSRCFHLEMIPCFESFDLIYFTPNFAGKRRRYERLKCERCSGRTSRADQIGVRPDYSKV